MLPRIPCKAFLVTLALTDRKRRILRRWSAALCAGSMLLTPLAARSSHPLFRNPVRSKPFSNVSIPLPANSLPTIVVSRDPFVPLASSKGLQALDASSSISVRAVALGKQPTALVQDGQTTRLVGIGDSLAGSTVVQIDSTGLTLVDSRTFLLSARNQRG